MSTKKSLHDYFFGLPGRIRKIRGELTQNEFAELIGVNQGTVHKYEKGIASPGAFTLKLIADYGRVTVEYLLSGGNKELPGPAESITIQSPARASPLAQPFLFGALDISALTQIIEAVEDLLSQRKKPLKPVKKALLLSLLYDHFQTTGRIPDQATIKEFLRRVA